jgi:hypothetical protein
MSRIVEPHPLDAECVEHPAPTEREQIRVIGLSELVTRHVLARAVRAAACRRSSVCPLRAARSTSTTSSGIGRVRELALDLGVPDMISAPTATRFSTILTRFGLQVDIPPPQSSDLPASQPVQGQSPKVAVPAFVIEDLEHVALGEGAHLARLARDPINQFGDVAHSVSLRHLVVENGRAKVEHLVNGPRRPPLAPRYFSAPQSTDQPVHVGLREFLNLDVAELGSYRPE